MQKYILLGSNNPNPSKRNLKVISSSDEPEQLLDIWNTISEFYDEIGEIYHGDLSQKAKKMIEKDPYLKKMFDIQLESIIWTVELIGIFKTIQTGPIDPSFFD